MFRDTLALCVVVLSILMPLAPLLVSFDSDTGISTQRVADHGGPTEPAGGMPPEPPGSSGTDVGGVLR